jgi:hypothetical protein
MSKRFTFPVLMLLAGLGLAGRWQRLSAMDNTGQDATIPVSEYLEQLGNQFDCHFTIEESWAHSEIMNSLASSLVSPHTPKPDDLNQRLAELSQTVPNFSFRIDKENGRIVHVIDSRLEQVNSYSLDQVVPRFEFDGTLDDLVRAISRNGIKVAPQNSFGLGDPMASRRDFTTIVHVNAEKRSVRALLSDFLPLKNYVRVMWVATTERREGAITQVNFKGTTPGAGAQR